MASGSTRTLRLEHERLRLRAEELQLRLDEAEETLRAIRSGEVDSLVIEGPGGPRVYALEGVNHSYRALVEAMSEGAASLNEDGTILYCNSRFAAMLGAPLKQVMGASIRDFLPADHRRSWEALLAGAGRGESRGEFSLRCQERELPVLLSVSPAQDGPRRTLCLVATDLSQQKRSQEILAAEELARSVLEQAAEAIVVCDARGGVLRASGVVEQLCGQNPLRRGFDEVFAIVLGSPVDRALRRAATRPSPVAAMALRGEVLRSASGVLVRPDGSSSDVLVSAAPLRAAGERILGCVIVLVDVTEVRERERHYRTLFDASPSGIVILEEGGRIVEFNEQAHCQLGYGRDEFSRLTLADIEAEGGPGSLEAHVESIAQTGAALFETRHLAKGGEVRDMVVDVRAIEVAGRRRLLSVWRDVTDRKRAEEALREADRNKNQFIAMLSHELRNPLAPIRNSLAILERAEPAGEQAARAKGVIQRQVRHMAQLIDDLLDLTRVSRGKIDLRREPLDLCEIVRRAVEDLRPDFDAADVALELVEAPGALAVQGDRTRLAQVVGNLLQNASKFTPPGGHVVLTVEREVEREVAVLRVRDDGVGISREMLPRLFQPFAQADDTLDRSRGGLGLGLTLVKGLLELHGGSVSVRSGGPGRGTEFTVRLPLRGGLLGAPAAEAPASGRARRRVLIIEDNLDAAYTLREVLELDGHEVVVAFNGPEGIERARSFQPEVVLCDIGLPGISGYEVARAFRSDAQLRDTFLVALSGYAMPDDLQRAAQAGFHRHLAKPPDLEDLERLVAEAAPGVGQGA